MSDLKEVGETNEPSKESLDMAKIQASMQGEREKQERELQEDLQKFEDRPKPPRLDAQQQVEANITASVDEGVNWVDKGIVDVPVAYLPWPEGIHGPEDFDHHISYDDVKKVTGQLQEMKPLIEQGYTSEDFARLDAANGLKYASGQQQIYELYYGERAIKAFKDGDNYDVPSGRHRLFVAKEIGLDSLPVHLKEKV